MRTKKTFIVFSIIIMLFLLGSVNVFALGENTDQQVQEYNIRHWRKGMDTNYNEEDFFNKDVLCSSSTLSSFSSDSTTDETTADVTKCDMNDPTIHKYYVWKILDGAQPFVSSGDVNPDHSSFSQTTYLFGVAGSSGAGWKEYTGNDVNKDGAVDVTDSSKTGFTKSSMKYVMVYLHRMSKGFDLYENFRTSTLYSGNGDSVFFYPM